MIFTESLTIFLCQYLVVLLLGLQSQNVRDRKMLAAAITSLLLGVTGWLVTGIVATAYHSGMLSLVFFSFIVAGPCGIVSSMWLHYKVFNNETKTSKKTIS